MCTHLCVEARGQTLGIIHHETRSLIGLEFASSARLAAVEPQGIHPFQPPQHGDCKHLPSHCVQLSVEILRLELLSLMWQTLGWLSCLHTPGFLIFQGLVPAFVLLVLTNSSSSLQIQTEVTHLRPFLVTPGVLYSSASSCLLVIISYVSFYYQRILASYLDMPLVYSCLWYITQPTIKSQKQACWEGFWVG